MAKDDEENNGMEEEGMEEVANGDALMTTDHDVIRSWAEDRGGRPTIVRGTRSRDSGLLRIDFGEKSDALDEVSWEDFFAIFDANDLVFLYQEEDKAGKQSRFSKFISRETAGLDEDEEVVDDTARDKDDPEGV